MQKQVNKNQLSVFSKTTVLKTATTPIDAINDYLFYHTIFLQKE